MNIPRHPGTAGAKLAAGVKATLAKCIVGALDRQGLTVREAQARTGNAAADFSRLRQGRLDRFSIERLLEIADRLGERLEVTIRAELSQTKKRSIPTPLADYVRPLRALCRRFAVRRLGAFGSVLRPDFDPEKSDIDMVVESTDHNVMGPQTSISNSRLVWSACWNVR